MSSVLCRTAYGLESPHDRLSGTHAEGTGHPDKLTVRGWRLYYAGGTRDVPDIRFRLAGYPAVFFYPVPAPVPAEMVPGTGYLYRIVLGRLTGYF